MCLCVTYLHDYVCVCVCLGLSRQLFSALHSSPLHLSEPIKRSAMQRGREVCMCATLLAFRSLKGDCCPEGEE